MPPMSALPYRVTSKKDGIVTISTIAASYVARDLDVPGVHNNYVLMSSCLVPCPAPAV